MENEGSESGMAASQQSRERDPAALVPPASAPLGGRLTYFFNVKGFHGRWSKVMFSIRPRERLEYSEGHRCFVQALVLKFIFIQNLKLLKPI